MSIYNGPALNRSMLHRTAIRTLAVPILALVAGCGSDATLPPAPPAAAISQPARVTVSPDAAVLLVGETIAASARVADRNGNTIASTVQFRAEGAVTVSASGGTVTATQVGSGLVIVQLGSLADTLVVTVTQPAPPPSGPPLPQVLQVTPAGAFVQVRIVGATPSPAVIAAFTTAAARVNGLLRSTGGAYPVPIDVPAGTCHATQPAINEGVPGLLITASVGPLDGPGSTLGEAGPCLVRSDATAIPAIGIMAFDDADMDLMASRGILDGVILHEMLHVLGIGTMWGPGGRGFVADPQGADPLFTGPQGTAAYGVFGALNAMLGVPVENTGGTGTRGGHWRESVFRGELMTGWVGGGMEMSRVTVSALADMGYDADLTKADPYTLASLLGGQISASLLREDAINERVIQPIGRIDRSGRRSSFAFGPG